MKRRHMAGFSLLVIAAAATGFFVARMTQDNTEKVKLQPGQTPEAAERKVLYWVAPMDPNFKSDKPGKSPMGMDLIPVYEDMKTDIANDEPSLRINPAVVNNIGVRTDIVRRTDLSRQIQTVGTIMADEEQRSDVHVRSEGWIEKLAIKAEGEAVKRGDLLFSIYSPDLVAAQSEYLQAIKLDRSTLTKAAAQRLNALGMTQNQIDQLREAGTPNRLVNIYAPQTGVVTMLNVREGIFVRPGDTIMGLADLSTVWMLADIFETETDWVTPGQAAVMTLPAFPGKIWKGKVDYIYPTATAKTRTVRARLRFPNPEGKLKPGMYANVVIETTANRDVLTIPQAALIRSSTGDRVILALGEGRFRPAQVVAGIESSNKVEILSGLEAGERIVTSGQFLIDSEASLDPALIRLSSQPADHGKSGEQQ